MIDLLLCDLNIQLTRTHIYDTIIIFKKKTYQSFITLHTSIHLLIIRCYKYAFIQFRFKLSVACLPQVQLIPDESALMASGGATNSDSPSKEQGSPMMHASFSRTFYFMSVCLSSVWSTLRSTSRVELVCTSLSFGPVRSTLRSTKRR